MAKSAKSGTPRTIPEGKTQVNFNINNTNLEKIKSIASAEQVSNADLYNLAVEKFIEQYEKKNGKVQIREKGKGLKGI